MDLIQSEYGWDDEKILDLRVARLSQMIAAIRLRKYATDMAHKLDIRWQVRAITGMVANTIQDDKARAEMVKQANRMTPFNAPASAGPKVNEKVKLDKSTSEEELEYWMEHGNTDAALEANNHRKSPMPFGI